MTLPDALYAVVILIFGQLSPRHLPHDAPEIARAIVQAVMEDGANRPALSSHDEDLAAMAVWAWGESNATIEPRPQSRDALAHESCGVWQIPCRFADRYTLVSQARYWLWLLHSSAQACPASPAAPLSSGACSRGRRLADGRIAEARRLLATTLHVEDSTAQPPRRN